MVVMMTIMTMVITMISMVVMMMAAMVVLIIVVWMIVVMMMVVLMVIVIVVMVIVVVNLPLMWIISLDMSDVVSRQLVNCSLNISNVMFNLLQVSKWNGGLGDFLFIIFMDQCISVRKM